jgi:L-alanine-DL-glutamate epimerase-like enolase superfamily enzyme
LHGLSGGELRIERLEGSALSVALREPFVIASGRVDATRAVEVRALVRWRGRTALGLGEAACLPPVTREDQGDALREVERAAGRLVDQPLSGNARSLEEALLAAVPESPVARAGIETAVLDAMARCAGVPMRALLGGERGRATRELETDVTIAIGTPERMAELAREWSGRGFRSLKIKIGKDRGKDVDADIRSLEAVGRAAPGARLRIDANAGYTAAQAIAVAGACERLGLGPAIECWEQPCAADDLDGMREVAAAVRAPVIADESVKTFDDFCELARRGYAAGVNLKLAKNGGVLAAHRMGLAAQGASLAIMTGGMVETRLGMTAAAHVVCALGGVDYVDLDTAWLLADDPYAGGYGGNGAFYVMPEDDGLGIARRV